jgi:hypothetical protein
MYIKCENCRETVHNLMYKAHLMGGCSGLKKCEACTHKRNAILEKGKNVK